MTEFVPLHIYNAAMELLTSTIRELAARTRQLEANEIPILGSWASAYNITEIDNGDTPYSVATTDVVIICDTNAGNITVNLPAIADSFKRVLFVKNIDTGIVTVDASGVETIDGQLTATINVQYDAIMLICTSTEWSTL